MDKLKAAWLAVSDWCNKHRMLFAAACGAFVAVYLESRSRPAPAERQASAAASTDAVVNLQQVVAEQGQAAAHHVIMEQYSGALAKLDAQQQEQAAQLAHDPVALAQFLVAPPPTGKP